MDMNHLIAFSKKNRAHTIYKVASSEDAFYSNPLINDNNGVEEYDPNDRQDQGKIFFLDLNVHQGVSNEIIDELKTLRVQDSINTSDYKALSNDNLSYVKYFATKQGGYLLFQQFYKKNIIGSRILSLKKMELLKGDFISLNKSAELVYSIDEQKVYFESIIKAKKILSGLESIYKEAGQKETKAFLGNEHLELFDDFDETKVTVLNKKRIQAELMKQDAIKHEKGADYDSFRANDLNECMEEIIEYFPNMVKDGKVLINNNNDLERYLLALDERLYTAKRSQQQRIATATRKV
ncbi:hypothetical protein [Lelliottia amnigena]|uniref:hypothetical protein n=1 Tax=Lelliottia amnigena TaxID=61646 RepID=UPI00293BE9B1|nr:hypothetical protein [Lelliottia amnigena]